MISGEKLPPIQVVLYFKAVIEHFKYLVERSEIHWKKDLYEYKKTLGNYKLNSEFDNHRDLWASFETIFPQQQRHSHLIMLVAMLEDFLHQLSISVEIHFKLANKYLENADEGDAIDRAKKYLNKTLVKLPTDIPEWCSIKDAVKLRHVIVHNGGCIRSERHSNQLEIIKNDPNLSIDNHARDFLNINKNYLPKLIDKVIVLVTKLIKRIQGIEELRA